MASANQWISDVPISMPIPPDPSTPALVDFGGFGFSVNGVVHNLNLADHEEYLIQPPPGASNG